MRAFMQWVTGHSITPLLVGVTLLALGYLAGKWKRLFYRQ